MRSMRPAPIIAVGAIAIGAMITVIAPAAHAEPIGERRSRANASRPAAPTGPR
jgi:hypothetical protein